MTIPCALRRIIHITNTTYDSVEERYSQIAVPNLLRLFSAHTSPSPSRQSLLSLVRCPVQDAPKRWLHCVPLILQLPNQLRYQDHCQHSKPMYKIYTLLPHQRREFSNLNHCLLVWLKQETQGGLLRDNGDTHTSIRSGNSHQGLFPLVAQSK